MKSYSTREAAKELGIALITLQGHVAKRTFAAVDEREVESASDFGRTEIFGRARKALEGIRPGRKENANSDD